jgi:DNA polymerase V
MTVHLYRCVVMRIIPLFASCGITGFESPATEYKKLGLSLDQLLISHPNATFIGQASGDSMQDVGIFDGDLLLVDRAETVSSGDVIIAHFNGEFICKLFDKKNRLLLSANKNNPPIKISAEDQIQVEGVVTRSIRMHKASPELNF